MIDWFKNIQHPKEYKFIIFDVCDFYPSITKTLLDKALDFASLHTTITPEHRHIITHAKSALLFGVVGYGLSECVAREVE